MRFTRTCDDRGRHGAFTGLRSKDLWGMSLIDDDDADDDGDDDDQNTKPTGV